MPSRDRGGWRLAGRRRCRRRRLLRGCRRAGRVVPRRRGAGGLRPGSMPGSAAAGRCAGPGPAPRRSPRCRAAGRKAACRRRRSGRWRARRSALSAASPWARASSGRAGRRRARAWTARAGSGPPCPPTGRCRAGPAGPRAAAGSRPPRRMTGRPARRWPDGEPRPVRHKEQGRASVRRRPGPRPQPERDLGPRAPRRGPPATTARGRSRPSRPAARRPGSRRRRGRARCRPRQTAAP